MRTRNCRNDNSNTDDINNVFTYKLYIISCLSAVESRKLPFTSCNNLLTVTTAGRTWCWWRVIDFLTVQLNKWVFIIVLLLANDKNRKTQNNLLLQTQYLTRTAFIFHIFYLHFWYRLCHPTIAPDNSVIFPLKVMRDEGLIIHASEILSILIYSAL